MHNHCFKLLLGLTIAPREIENNAYAKFWSNSKEYYGIFEKGPYVMGRVVRCQPWEPVNNLCDSSLEKFSASLEILTNWSNLKSRLSLIFPVNVVLNRTVVVDSD